METLECEAFPSCSRGADTPDPVTVNARHAVGVRCRCTRDDQRRGNTELMRSARTRQTPDDRVARHRNDADSRRSARARLTAAERDAWCQEHQGITSIRRERGTLNGFGCSSYTFVIEIIRLRAILMIIRIPRPDHQATAPPLVHPLSCPTPLQSQAAFDLTGVIETVATNEELFQGTCGSRRASRSQQAIWEDRGTLLTGAPE